LKELTIGDKTVPMAFFIVDVKGQYNACAARMGLDPCKRVHIIHVTPMCHAVGRRSSGGYRSGQSHMLRSD
jgi:hypothetical protein